MSSEKSPHIRFDDFTDDWEQRKLSELVEKYEDPVETPHDGYTRLGIRSHAKGTFHEYVEPGHELGTAQMHRVAANKLIFNITFAWEHAVAITDEQDAGKLVSHRFPQFSLSDSLHPEFLKYVILNEGFHHNLYLASPGGAGRNRVLKIDEALDYPIYYPSVDEQQKIGTFFDGLTDLITLHQHKYEKLKILKKSMLDNCFPKNGERVPKIRFSGFTGDWQQRKLSDIYGTIRNAFVGTASPYYVDDGHFYLESNNVKNGSINKNTQVFINDEFYYRQKDKWLHTGDMVMVQSGHVGHSAVVPESLDNTAAHALIMFQNQKVETDPYFLNAEYQTGRAKRQIGDITKGNTIKHILASDMKDFAVMVPSLPEQHRIADYFRSLDRLITIHQRKLLKLKEIKKSLLQKMFI